MNKNKLFKQILAISAVFVIFAIPTESQAVASFARQTGQACNTCHFQHYPTLNEFGRAFKANGYTLVGKQGTVEGEKLSFPETLNASLVTKLRYQKTNGDTTPGQRDTNNGELQFPDEFALWLGGRVSNNIGFLLEGQLIDPDGSFLASFKMPFMFDVGRVKAGVIPFTTDALGAAFGLELLNTGAVRNLRMMEHRKDMSAQQYVGTATAAEGFAFVVTDSRYFVNLSKWSPNHAAVANGLQNGSPSATYLRAALTPRAGNWDLGAGFQSWSGSAYVGGDGFVTLKDTEAWAVDGQAQGAIGAMPLGIYLSHAKADGSSAGDTANLFNGNPNAKSATAIAVELGILPHKATLMLAYRKGDNGNVTDNGDNAWTLGGTYQIVQNIQLQLNYSKYSGSAFDTVPAPADGDQLVTLMLFGSF
jgi:hypothetical protein